MPLNCVYNSFVHPSIPFDAGNVCSIPNQLATGNCAIKENCVPYVRLYTNRSITIDGINFLRELQCDNHDVADETVVCCPLPSPSSSSSGSYMWVYAYLIRVWEGEVTALTHIIIAGRPSIWLKIIFADCAKSNNSVFSTGEFPRFIFRCVVRVFFFALFFTFPRNVEIPVCRLI